MTQQKKRNSTIEPLSPTLRANLLDMVDRVGTYSRTSDILHIGQGSLSSAMKNGAGRNLRQRLERGHAAWARTHYGAESGTGRVVPPTNNGTANVAAPPIVPPIVEGFGVAAKNTARLDALGGQLARLERKLDALLVGFGLEPTDYLHAS